MKILYSGLTLRDYGFLLLLIPSFVFFMPNTPYNIQPPDVVLLLIIGALIFGLLRRKDVYRPTKLDKYIFIYLGGAAVSIIAIWSLKNGFIELSKMAYAAMYYFAAIHLVKTNEQYKLTIRLWMVTSLIICSAVFVSTIIYYSIGFPTAFIRVYNNFPYVGQVVRPGGLTTPSYFMSYLLISGLLALGYFYSLKRGKTKKFALISFVLISINALLSYSYVLFGYIVGLYMIFYSHLKGRLLRIMHPFILALLTLLFLLLTFVYHIQVLKIEPLSEAPYSSFETNQTDHSFVRSWEIEPLKIRMIFNPTPYLFTKDIAWRGFKSNPIFGIGLGNFGIIMKEAFCSGKIPEMYAGQDPHCTILGHSVQTGLVGLATLLLFWIMTLKNLNRRISHSSNFRKNTLVAMRAALIGMAISSINIDIMNFRFLWFALGLATAVDNINEFSQLNEKTRICQQKFF